VNNKNDLENMELDRLKRLTEQFSLTAQVYSRELEKRQLESKTRQAFHKLENANSGFTFSISSVNTDDLRNQEILYHGGIN
tara:strand:- start:1167 stop:1409 length:243 start_codon:yes stop_codon:yes gene_type:complete